MIAGIVASWLALPTKVKLFIVGCIIVSVVLLAVRHAGYRSGAQHQQAVIERRDAHAVSGAAKARETVQSCFTSGGEWDVSSGVCRR